VNEKVIAFTRMQIWFHKHVIHFMALFIFTGLPILSPAAFGWIAWIIGFPLSAVFNVQNQAQTIALGLQAARVVHWTTAFFFTLTVIPFAVVMLARWKEWQIYPDAIGIAPMKDGLEQLKRRYIQYTDARMGKYNMGQKGLAWLMIIGTAGMMFSGLALMLRTQLPVEWVGVARFVHDLFFVAMGVGLIAHIYLAAVLPLNRAGLKAMFGDGEIDAEEVRHHHPLWWAKLKREDTRRIDA
jgi:formate dehydrogenase subunit gamma